MMQVYDNTPCELGEGPLWHPLLGQLFWFDILNQTLYCKAEEGLKQWHFDKIVSAAGWIDSEHLLIASENSLFKFNLNSATQTHLCDLEADNNATRSNDGRADPFGGFWIGTMGKSAEANAGAIYRYYAGELRPIIKEQSITNSICFAPDKSCAYYADTVEKIIWRQPLNQKDGWPTGERETLIDFNQQGINPDGAVTDAQGNLWIAQWGLGRVAQYSASGEFIQTIKAPATNPTCPAFGGEHYNRLFLTSAKEHLSDSDLAKQPAAGQLFFTDLTIKGQAEPRVILQG